NEYINESHEIVIEIVGRNTFNRSIYVIKRGEKIVVFDTTTEDTVDFNISELFYGQYQLFGSTMGSREELNELLLFMEKHEIKPIVGHTYPLHQIEEAFDFLRDNKQFGKIVIEI